MSAAKKVFSIPVRIYYEDTDTGGVVYYANYLRFMERARTDWLRAQGFEQTALADEHQIVLAVKQANIKYIKPARLDDSLEVSAKITRIGSASITFNQQVSRARELLCDGEVRIVCLDTITFRPKAIPEFFLNRIQVDQNS
jgi:acyl-CoA thioester hydrolase